MASVVGVRDVRLVEVPSRPPGRGEVRVRTVMSAQNPGTTVTRVTGQHARMRDDYSPARLPRLTFPFTIEGRQLGEVVEVGPGVENVKVGDQVVYGGPQQEEKTLRAGALRRLPEGRDPEQFLLDPSVAFRALKRSRLSLGDDIVILGQGFQGLGLTALASLAGANRVIVSDLYEKRLEVARRLGATHTVNPAETSLVEFVLEELRGEIDEGSPPLGRGAAAGADIVYDFAGAPEGLRDALNIVRFNGKIVIAAMYRRALEAVNLGADFHIRDLQIISSSPGGNPALWPWTDRRSSNYLWRLTVEGRLDLRPTITHRMRFTEIAKALELLEKRKDEAIQIILKF